MAVVSFSQMDWLHAIRTFCAAMLALYIALWADLPNPYWAVGTVYVTSQIHASETYSKAAYRLLGTSIGSAAAGFLVPNLVNEPALLCVALAVWVGACLYLALLDRTPRSYAAMLAGCTAPLVGFPSVSDPGAIFDIAVARTQEISIGIASAALVSALVLPKPLLPIILARIESWLGETRSLAHYALAGRPRSEQFSLAMLKQAEDTIGLESVSHHLAFEPTARHGISSLPRLRTSMLGILPILSSIIDRSNLLSDRRALSPPMEQLLTETRAWLEIETATIDDARRLREAIRQATPEMVTSVDWDAVLSISLADRLTALVDVQQETHDSVIELKTGRRSRRPLFDGAVHPVRHRDHYMALLSAIAAIAAILATSAFWISTGWPEGSGAPLIAAVTCCLFAGLDNPVPAISSFGTSAVYTVVGAALYLFAILPLAGNFEMLAIALAPGLIFCGLLMTNPKTVLAGMCGGLVGATVLSITRNYSADFASFTNFSSSVLIGVWSGSIATSIIRSVSPAWRARRLLRQNHQTVIDAAISTRHVLSHSLTALMLDRIGLLASRAHAIDKGTIGLDRILSEVNTGAAITELSEIAQRAPLATSQSIKAIGRTLRDHYGRWDIEPAPAIAVEIDRALRESCSRFDDPVMQRTTLLLVELRRCLFPASWPPTFVGEHEGSHA